MEDKIGVSENNEQEPKEQQEILKKRRAAILGELDRICNKYSAYVEELARRKKEISENESVENKNIIEDVIDKAAEILKKIDSEMEDLFSRGLLRSETIFRQMFIFYDYFYFEELHLKQRRDSLFNKSPGHLRKLIGY